MNIYLDNAATTSISAKTKDYIISLLDVYGNPSSLHSEGNKARAVIESARDTVARFINANKRDIIFTGSGSASNTLGVRGYIDTHFCTVLYSPILHKSILKCLDKHEYKYVLKVDKQGLIDIADLENWLKALQDKAFIVISYADSEIGTIQNVEEIVNLVHKYSGTVFVDCTGSISTIPINVKALQADIIAFSGHKLGALKGVGVLYKRKDINLKPLICGSQENGLIGGTENVLGIASLDSALSDYDYTKVNSQNRNYVYNYLMRNISDCYLVGADIASPNRLANNLYMCFKGVEGESLMLMLDLNGIQVSTGSACNSGSLSPSPALMEIGLDPDDYHSCIRISFSGKESKEQLDYVCEKLKSCVESLRRFV